MGAAEGLLNQYPNLWLRGRVELGYSVVASLLGDGEGALAHAKLAIASAERSGHFRTRLAGLVNLSHALHATADLPEARKCADAVLSQDRAGMELRLSAFDVLANVSISEGQLELARRTLSEMTDLLASAKVALR